MAKRLGSGSGGTEAGSPVLRLLSASPRGEEASGMSRPAAQPSPHPRAAGKRLEAGHPRQSAGTISWPEALSAGKTILWEFPGSNF